MSDRRKKSPAKPAGRSGARQQKNGKPIGGKSGGRPISQKPKEKFVHRRDTRAAKATEVEQGNQPDIGTIQWFPGHMARTRRKIKESLSMVDAVVEVVDARIPLASRNPELDSLTGKKPRLVILNKADLADEAATKRWIAWFERRGTPALALDCKSGRGFNGVTPALRGLLSDLLEKWESKGANRAVRAMIVGIPNVGKSSFINRINRGGKAKVEDRPGVTRMNQWFVTEDGTQLLDTPGVLWPKFDDQTVAMRLAFTGAIKDQVLDMEEMAWELLKVLNASYRPLLTDRYGLTEEDFAAATEPWDLLAAIGRRRGMLLPGGDIDTLRAAVMLLDEYRGGKLGRLTLEYPPEEVSHHARYGI